MAGHARTKALTCELERRTALTFDDWDATDSPSHLDYVCFRIEGGTTTKDLAAELSASLGFELSYAQMMHHLRKTFGNDATDAQIDSARARASHCLVEESKELVDGATPMTIQVAAARAKQRNWMAERYNPQRFGQSKQTNVSISVTALHLDALRAQQPIVTVGPNGAPLALPASVDDSVSR